METDTAAALGQLESRVSGLRNRLEIVEQHLNDAAAQVGRLVQENLGLWGEVKALWGKVQTLPDQPLRENCPHCHRVITPGARRCPVCQKPIPRST